MVNNQPRRKCPHCGEPAIPQARFCTNCGKDIPETLPELPDEKIPEYTTREEVIEEPTRLEPPPESIEEKPIIDIAISLISSMRDHFSTILVSLGILAILAAISFSILVLLPKELVSDIEVPPVEGIVFDIFVLIGILAILVKESLVVLGYIPKKSIYDRWFSLALLLIFWTNLVTFSLGLVNQSIFYTLGIHYTYIFSFLSIITLALSLLYFIRLNEPLFSCTLGIVFMSVLYLMQWLLILDPLVYTSLIYFTFIFFLMIVLRFKDILPLIIMQILLPLMFLSPYLLSNSFILAILVLLLSIPLVEAIIENFVIKEIMNRESVFQSVAQLTSSVGLVTIGFSVFYGYIDPLISLILLTIPVLGLITLKIIKSDCRRTPGRDFPIPILLIFNVGFFDLFITDNLILAGMSLLLVVQATFTFFEYLSIKHNYLPKYAGFILLSSLTISSIISIDFIVKVGLILIPAIVLFIFAWRKIVFDPIISRISVFGGEFLILLSFIRTPQIDLLLIPIFLVFTAVGLTILTVINMNYSQTKYSLDLMIYTLIYEIVLLGVMFWTESSIEMLLPVVCLLIFVGLISGVQLYRKLNPNFLWLNATYIVCFGIMTFWNEFTPQWSILIAIMLMLPSLLGIFTQNQLEVEVFQKNSLFYISLTALGLTLIVFFEEFDPITHSLLFLAISLFWIILYFLSSPEESNLGSLALLTFPGIIFVFELLLHESLFTPISDVTYFFPIALVIPLPAITLQVDKVIRKTKTHLEMITPFLIGSVVFSVILSLAFIIYDFNPEEAIILLLGYVLALLISVFLIERLYESILLLIASFLPLFYINYLDLTIPIHYLLPALPILVNFVIGLRYFKTDLSLQIHEFLLLGYICLFIIFNTFNIHEYSTALVAIFLISWQFLGIIKLRDQQNQQVLSLTLLLNQLFILGLIIFIDPLASEFELFLGEVIIHFKLLLIALILVTMIISTIFHMIKWQLTEISSYFIYLRTVSLILSSSSFVFILIVFLQKTLPVKLDLIITGILIGSLILLMLFLTFYLRNGYIKKDILIAGFDSTAIWVILSSVFLNFFELVFLWLILAPLLLIIFLMKKDGNNIALFGFIFYFLAGLKIIENTLDFIILGEPNWLTILSLIIFGLELVTLGIYASLKKKIKNNNNNTEIETPSS